MANSDAYERSRAAGGIVGFDGLSQLEISAVLAPKASATIPWVTRVPGH